MQHRDLTSGHRPVPKGKGKKIRKVSTRQSVRPKMMVLIAAYKGKQPTLTGLGGIPAHPVKAKLAPNTKNSGYREDQCIDFHFCHGTQAP